ncbi:hypothetical protein HMPREF0742_01221 [Rothia aeria F0184]|uniref:Uncharacterized protein n=1 Tax=Rothia aeria F0184 TaxID=888019 RepID=U7V3R1_9MICC|nr:hypothetical protein HMPREF0742_01221 [Rothia aeria F0184]
MDCALVHASPLMTRVAGAKTCPVNLYPYSIGDVLLLVPA